MIINLILPPPLAKFSKPHKASIIALANCQSSQSGTNWELHLVHACLTSNYPILNLLYSYSDQSIQIYTNKWVFQQLSQAYLIPVLHRVYMNTHLPQDPVSPSLGFPSRPLYLLHLGFPQYTNIYRAIWITFAGIGHSTMFKKTINFLRDQIYGVSLLYIFLVPYILKVKKLFKGPSLMQVYNNIEWPIM